MRIVYLSPHCLKFRFKYAFSRDVITVQDPSKLLSLSGLRGGIFISVYNFTAQ